MKKVTIKSYALLIGKDEACVNRLIKNSKLPSQTVDTKVRVLVEANILKSLKTALKSLKESEAEILELKKTIKASKKKTIIKKKLLVKPKKVLKKRVLKPKKRNLKKAPTIKKR